MNETVINGELEEVGELVRWNQDSVGHDEGALLGGEGNSLSRAPLPHLRPPSTHPPLEYTL